MNKNDDEENENELKLDSDARLLFIRRPSAARRKQLISFSSRLTYITYYIYQIYIYITIETRTW
jgi:hypothetical protein